MPGCVRGADLAVGPKAGVPASAIGAREVIDRRAIGGPRSRLAFDSMPSERRSSGCPCFPKRLEPARWLLSKTRLSVSTQPWIDARSGLAKARWSPSSGFFETVSAKVTRCWLGPAAARRGAGARSLGRGPAPERNRTSATARKSMAIAARNRFCTNVPSSVSASSGDGPEAQKPSNDAIPVMFASRDCSQLEEQRPSCWRLPWATTSPSQLTDQRALPPLA
jgi:hypothetical protein